MSFKRRHSNPLQYSCLGIPMDRGDWWATNPWGRKKLDTTEGLSTAHICHLNNSEIHVMQP